MRIHLVSQAKAVVDAVSELAKAHGVGLAAYSAGEVFGTCARIEDRDLVVVDGALPSLDLMLLTKLLRYPNVDARVAWLVADTEQLPMPDWPKHWSTFEKPLGVEALAGLLSL